MVIAKVAIEQADEFFHRDTLPVPMVEELVLLPPEEPFHGSIVGRAAFP